MTVIIIIMMIIMIARVVTAGSVECGHGRTRLFSGSSIGVVVVYFLKRRCLLG
jgi:hypothetical protein